MANSDPIVIIGGGIIGTSVAYHIRNLSRPVILLEQRKLLGGETTAASIAMFGWGYHVPDPLREYSWNHYKELISNGNLEFNQIGALYIRKSQAAITELEDTKANLHTVDRPVQLLNAKDVHEYGVYPKPNEKALYIPNEGFLDTGEIIQHYADAIDSAGVEILTETTVEDIRIDCGSVVGVDTSNGYIEATSVVNTAGPWAPFVNGLVGVSLPLKHNRGPILVLQRDTEFSLPATSFENGVYFREEGASQAFAGRAGCDYFNASRIDPDHARSVASDFYLTAQQMAKRSIPILEDSELVTEWVGLRTITPDGHPIIGEMSVDGFLVACGLSGAGVTLSPAVGHVLAEYIDPDGSKTIPDSVSPRRFSA